MLGFIPTAESSHESSQMPTNKDSLPSLAVQAREESCSISAALQTPGDLCFPYKRLSGYEPTTYPLPPANSPCPAVPPASTLSQLSDSGQTLSEDSGVDIGEVEASGKDRGRQQVSVKSRSPKEAPRSDGTAEGTSKPVRVGRPRYPAGLSQAGGFAPT